MTKNKIYQKQNSDNTLKKRKKQFNIKHLLIGLTSIIILVVLVVCFYLMKILEKPVFSEVPIVTGGEVKEGILDHLSEPDDETTTTVSAKPKYWGKGRVKIYIDPAFPIIKVDPINSNVENILVVGLDSRSAYEKQARTDSIMLVSIDKFNNTVALTSFMRDIQVKIPGRTNPTKINSAYVFGGIGLLINTMNQNFGLDIQKFAMVDMWSSENIINAAGGVEINVTKSEISYINGGVNETNNLFKNISEPVAGITKSGNQFLNGRQAVSYGRIRKVGNDQGRTQRQRTILSALMNSFKNSSITRKMSIFETACESFETNIQKNDMLFLAIDVLNGINKTKQYRVPENGMFTTNTETWQITIDFTKQLPALHKFIWDESLNNSNISVNSSSINSDSQDLTSQTSGDVSPPISSDSSSNSGNSSSDYASSDSSSLESKASSASSNSISNSSSTGSLLSDSKSKNK